MIVLDRVGRRFGDKDAVRELSLDVREGEIFGLLGPNGAGKTTTIRMLTGLLRPNSGTITIGGHDIVREPMSAKAQIGYVPDRAFLYEKLTVREHLSFVGSIYGVTDPQRIEAILDTIGIKDIEDALIEGCSQGMRQRLLFAAALLHGPRALVIDEPFVGLDPFGVLLIKDIIRDCASRGTAIFLATHSLHIAQELCTRVGLIKQGGLVAMRSAQEIADSGGGLETLFIRELGDVG